MGFSYRKSFKAGPIRVTASKSGVSYSAGVKGARVTKRANGRVQTTVSVPGTGVRYTSTSKKPSAQPAAAAAARAARREAVEAQAAEEEAIAREVAQMLRQNLPAHHIMRWLKGEKVGFFARGRVLGRAKQINKGLA